MRQELFHIWHKKFGQRIAVFGVEQTEFLVFSPDGWAWVPMINFSPLDARIYDYENRVQYVNEGRPGMVPDVPKLVLKGHNNALDLKFSEKDGASASTKLNWGNVDWDNLD